MFDITEMNRTEEAAKRIAAVLRAGDVVKLIGEMGAGKTTFVKELVRALNSDADVTSPTFALAQHYDGPLPVWHIDLYRVEDPEELEDIGYETYFYPEDAVTLIEWPQIAEDYLPDDTLAITIHLTDNARTLIPDAVLMRRLEANR